MGKKPEDDKTWETLKMYFGTEYRLFQTKCSLGTMKGLYRANNVQEIIESQ